MTPLAQRIARELTLSKSRRTFNDGAGLLDRIMDAHCFDVTDVLNLGDQLVSDLGRLKDVGEVLAFLPAPVTWIEYRMTTRAGTPTRKRLGILVEEFPGDRALCRVAVGNEREFCSFYDETFHLPLINNPHLGMVLVDGEVAADAQERAQRLGGHLLAHLALINTPRTIGRRQHMPHAGLQRELARAKGMVGKFPLHAWTEIRLEVTPPKIYDDEVHEARLSGAKAYHFCKKFLRIKNGRIEYVRAHWRGDPAIGIKRARYKLVGPPAEPTHQAP